MLRQSLTEYGKPLQATEAATRAAELTLHGLGSLAVR